MVARGIRRFRIPAPPEGFHRIRCQVGADARLACLFSTFDSNAAWKRYVEQREDDPARQLQAIPPGAKGLVAVAAVNGWRNVAAFPFKSYAYAFDVAGDDFCVVADTRCDSSDKNALTFSTGEQSISFHAGDAVNHLQCDASDGIWAGYFDEGVFGDTIARHGIVRFNRSGEVTSYYAGDIADCYSLNVSKVAIWSCWYTEFDAVKLDQDCHEDRWTNDFMAGVSAIAVAEPNVLLVSGYPPERNRIVLAEMHQGALRVLHEFDAQAALGVDLERAWFSGRGSLLHVVDGDEHLSVPVAWFVAQALD